ncbi:MAG TPA: ATP-binding protein, partial [Polyangia bacterium]|nr:ATP-binding protein [Polyangia bacterium]
LEQRTAGDERAKKHVGRIGEQLSLANGIITTLLDMIRDRPLERARVRLDVVMPSVLGALPLPPRVVLSGVDTLPPIDADAGQIRQVFMNLVENAIHAAGPEGELRINGRVDGAFIEVAVEDSGPGVDVEIRRRLFEPLVTSKAKGIGLGLALVKRILVRHGGDIVYAPAASGGARFVVRLPIEAPHA